MIGRRSVVLVGLAALALMLAGCAGEGEGRIEEEDDQNGQNDQDGGDGGDGGATVGAGDDNQDDGGNVEGRGEAPGPGAALAVLGVLGSVAYLSARRK